MDRIIGVKITASTVTISNSKYVPLEKIEGKKVPGTGTTKQFKIAQFKRNIEEIPDEVRKKFNKSEQTIIENELKNAHESDIAPKIQEKLGQAIEALSESAKLVHLMKISDEDIKTLSSIVRTMKKAKKNQSETTD
jgi:hypothetical protein